MRMGSSTLVGALYHAGRSILLGQHRLAVTTRNVSSAGDPGYSRQSATGGTGAGGDFTVLRQRDAFLDQVYRSTAADSARAEAQQTALAQVEAAVGEPSDTGLGAALGRFWDAWERVAGSAHDAVARGELLGATRSLTARFNDVARSLDAQRLAIRDTMQRQVREVNDLARRVADINARLPALAPGDSGAAQLADERDTLLDRLATLSGAEAIYMESGELRVLLSGRSLVAGGTAGSISMDAAGDIVWPDGQKVAAGGSLRGLSQVLHDDLPAVAAELDRLADSLATAVNGVHQTGFGRDGVTGRDFFVAGGGAAGLALAIGNSDEIAAAAGAGAEGDGQVAQAIADLRDAGLVAGSPLAPGQNLTADRHLRALVGDLGLRVATAQQGAGIAERQLQAVDQERRSVSGVSLDEEALQLMELQRAIAATSRVVTALDDVLGRIVDYTGRVGR